MTSPRNQIIDLIEHGYLPEDKIADALITTEIYPNASSWYTFIDHMMLWLGGVALAVSVVFFTAWNWNKVGRFAKFGIVEFLLILSIAVYYKFGHEKVAGKAALLISTLLLGVLLALFNQTYQTGADPWHLFFNWAILMLPWALIGRFPGIWLVWTALIDLSIFLFINTFQNIFLSFSLFTNTFFFIFFVNALILTAFELLRTKCPWLSKQWALRVLAAGNAVPITMIVVNVIFNNGEDEIFPWLAWFLWLGAMYYIYRKVKPELFMLACLCISVIVVIVSLMLYNWHLNASNALVTAFVIIALGAGSVFWLKKINQELNS